MKGLIAMCAVLLVGCTSAPAASVTPASPSPTPSPSSLVTVLPSSSPTAADLPLTSVAFSCRLPVMVEASGGAAVSLHGGFITFPAATFTADPRGVINASTQGGVLTTAEAPVLTGAAQTGLPAYDPAQGRWLPVGRAQTNADGASYAYSTLASKTIHVVSVGTGAERTFNADVNAPDSIDVVVEDVEGSSVYLAAGYPDGPARGLWRLDLNSGTVSKVMDIANLFAVRAGSAWVGYQDPDDPNPPKSDSGNPLFDTLVRVDLATGQRTAWDYRPEHGLGVTAVDGDKVVVHVFDPTGGPAEIRLLSGPVSGGESNGDLVYSGPMSFDVPWIDGDRLWFGNDRGIYLYDPANGMQKVYAFAGSHQTVFPAGFCR